MNQERSMNGLRIYTNPRTDGARGGDGVFYSRRAGGPYYRWDYEEKLEQWRAVRMSSTDFSPQELCMSRWKTVPAGLQMRLQDHYQE